MPRLSEGKKQLTKFAFIGGLAVLTDLACYYLFLQLFPDDAFPRPLDNEAVAKTLSFLCGLSVTYQLNKRWTWRRRWRRAVVGASSPGWTGWAQRCTIGSVAPGIRPSSRHP